MRGYLTHFLFWRRTEPDSYDGLTTLRFLFSSLFMAPMLMTFVMTFIADRVVPEASWVVPVTVGLALLSIVVPQFASRRTIEADDETRFANWYRTTFFLGFALCEAPFLIAFALCFVVGNALLPALIALPGFLIGMLVIAPTRRNLDNVQSRAAASGSPVNVIEALKRQTPPVKRT